MYKFEELYYDCKIEPMYGFVQTAPLGLYSNQAQEIVQSSQREAAAKPLQDKANSTIIPAFGLNEEDVPLPHP